MVWSQSEHFGSGKWAKLAVFSTLLPVHYRYEFGYLVKVYPKIVAYQQKKTKLSHL